MLQEELRPEMTTWWHPSPQPADWQRRRRRTTYDYTGNLSNLTWTYPHLIVRLKGGCDEVWHRRIMSPLKRLSVCLMANYITKAKAWLVEVLCHLGRFHDWIMNQKSPEGSKRKLRSNVSSDTLREKNECENVPSRYCAPRPNLRVRKKKLVNYLAAIYPQ